VGICNRISTGGGADESGQILNLSVSNNNNALFSAQPSIDLGTGTLTFTPVANAFGSATVTVTLQDDGGTDNGGVDTTTKTFVITVRSVNDVPSFTKGSDQSIDEDAGPQTVAAWASGMSRGPANEDEQTLEFLGHNR
jgi:hypothetical protein